MELEQELKELIITELKLEDVQPADIADDDPLFGEGLGLDSLDAVELIVLLQKRFKVNIEGMEEARAAFTSIHSLADYIRSNREDG